MVFLVLSGGGEDGCYRVDQPGIKVSVSYRCCTVDIGISCRAWLSCLDLACCGLCVAVCLFLIVLCVSVECAVQALGSVCQCLSDLIETCLGDSPSCQVVWFCLPVLSESCLM